MVVEIDPEKCHLCHTYVKPISIYRCPCSALRIRDKKIEVTEFLCEDCNECGYVCPDKAITIKVVTF
jgi:MinD superfamily P-loop ATPase